MDGRDRETGFDQDIDDQARGPLNGDALDARGVKTAHQLGQASRVMRCLAPQAHDAELVDHAYGMQLAGPVQPAKTLLMDRLLQVAV